ncbi:hypothetical protein FRAHR75_40121 [Frankia sp. Hr75.2]|nr:hypothetical protein FRAHR75_40121 [Frankia sp. Hr75.2]
MGLPPPAAVACPEAGARGLARPPLTVNGAGWEESLSRRRGLNPRPIAYEAIALPLSYSGIGQAAASRWAPAPSCPDEYARRRRCGDRRPSVVRALTWLARTSPWVGVAGLPAGDGLDPVRPGSGCGPVRWLGVCWGVRRREVTALPVCAPRHILSTFGCPRDTE